MLFKKKIKKIDNLAVINFKNYVCLSIWDDGPGKPFDNAYIITEKQINIDSSKIFINFDDNEKCLIENPSKIITDNKRIIIESASKITWEFYYYGKIQTPDTKTIVTYELQKDGRVKVKKEGYFNEHKIIDSKFKNAFELQSESEINKEEFFTVI